MSRAVKFLVGLVSLILGLMIGIWMLYSLFRSGDSDVSFSALMLPGTMIWVGVSWLKQGWVGPPLESLPLNHPDLVAAFARSRQAMSDFISLLSRFPDNAIVLCSPAHYTDRVAGEGEEPVWAKVTGHSDRMILVETDTGRATSVSFDYILDWQVRAEDDTVYGGQMLRVLLDHTRKKWGKLPGRWRKLEETLSA